MSLRKKTITGLFWTFSQQFSVQVINFIVQVILARILMPAEFGLIGMLTAFIAIGNTLMDSGLTSSLIRKPDADQKDYSTVFFINLLGSLLVYVLLFATAPLIAAFFKQPVLIPIVRVYTLSFFIRAFVGVQTTRLTKAMNFRLQMMMQIPSVIAGSIVGIVMAYKGYGVWSLVWLNLVQSFLFTLQHWVFAKWRPDFVIDKERLKYHLTFGYKLTLSGLLETIYQNIYNIIIGRFFSTAQLGFYTRARTLQQFPVQNISNALNKVTYPMFSSIQHDNEKLKTAYRKLMQQVLFWIAPVMIIAIVLALPLIRFLLTEKWLPAVPYFQLLCVSGILYPLQVYNLNILNVKGRSDLFFKLEVIKKVFITIGIFCAIPFGIYGLLYFQLITSVFSFFINTHFSGRMISYPVGEQLRDVGPIFALAFATGIIASLIDGFIVRVLPANDLARIMIVGGLFFSIYLGTGHVSKMAAIMDF